MNQVDAIQITSNDRAPLPPVAKGAPIVGNALDMARDPADFFVRMYQQYGPIFRIKILKDSYTVLAGPEANLFMAKYSKQLLRSREFWQGMVSEFGASKLLVSEDGDTHTQLRRVMKRGFARSALDGRFQELIRITEGILDEQWQPGNDVFVVQAMQRMVTEQLGMLMMNQSPGAHVDDIRTFIKRVLEVRVTKQRPAFYLKAPSYRRAKARCLALGQSIIDQHQPDPESPTYFLDDLLQASAADKGLIPDSDLVSEVLSPYFAGLDTVANTTSAMVYELLKHPEILVKLEAEAGAIFAGGEITPKTVRDEMPISYGVLMETLRLHPIAVAAMRNATQDFLFHGYQIREGEPLYMATTVSHFLPRFYEDPDVFDIERFHKPRAEHRQPGAFAPFGLGPHACLGAGLAETLIMLSMATLIHRRTLRLNPVDYQMKLSVAPTPGPEMKFKVRVIGQR